VSRFVHLVLFRLGACLALGIPAARGEGSLNGGRESVPSFVGSAFASGNGSSESGAVGGSRVGLERECAALAAQNEVFARQVEALRLRLEALGVSGASSVQSVVEQRLVSAVNDLRQSELDRKALREALASLCETLSVYMPILSKVDSEAALVLATRLKGGHQALSLSCQRNSVSGRQSGAAGSVVARVDRNLGVVVANGGADSQVRLGAPVLIERAGRMVGAGRAVDVRAQVFAVLVERVEEGQAWPKEGDTVRMDIRK
jgi:hypothetical protein